MSVCVGLNVKAYWLCNSLKKKNSCKTMTRNSTTYVYVISFTFVENIVKYSMLWLMLLFTD